jgi:hypothetical protein
MMMKELIEFRHENLKRLMHKLEDNIKNKFGKIGNSLDGALSGDSMANVCEHGEKYLRPTTFLTAH